MIDPEFRRPLPPAMDTAVRRFLNEVVNEPISLKEFGLGDSTVGSVFETLRTLYELRNPVGP